MARKSFILHIDSLSVINKLTDEQAGKLFRAIYSHHGGPNIELDQITDIVFEPFRNQFERDEEYYQKTVERNQRNGSQGGRPKTHSENIKPKKTHSVKVEPKKADSDSDSKNDSKNKNDNESKNVPTELFVVDLKLPFDSIQFQDAWKTLLKQPKWKKKTSDALKVSLNKLSQVSEPDAIRMMQNAIEGSWQGLFPLKPNEKPNPQDDRLFGNVTKSGFQKTLNELKAIDDAELEQKRIEANRSLEG